MIRIIITPLIIILLIPLTFVGFVKGFNLRLLYPYNYKISVAEENVIDSFGRYSVGDGYRFRTAAVGEEGENKLAVYVKEESNQKLFLSILREHLADDLEKLKVLDKTKVEETFRSTSYESRKVSSFRLTYLIPLLVPKDDLSMTGRETMIKGINVKKTSRFETPFAEVFYVMGEFSRVGLFKKPNGRWGDPAPVFDFQTLHQGALALIKSKKSGRVMLAVSVNNLEQFKESEFRKFVESMEPA